MSLLHWVLWWSAVGTPGAPTAEIIVGYVTGTATAKAIGGTVEWRDPVGGSVRDLTAPGGTAEEVEG